MLFDVLLSISLMLIINYIIASLSCKNLGFSCMKIKQVIPNNLEYYDSDKSIHCCIIFERNRFLIMIFIDNNILTCMIMWIEILLK